MKKKGTATPIKKEVVKEFAELLKAYPIVGAVNMESLPAKQLQTMRSKLRNTVVLKMTKRRLMQLAIEKASKEKPGLEKISEYLVGMPALLFTKENPFALFKTVKKNKSPAPARAGQKAPKDIKVPAGPTPFAPGPVIGELGALGIKSKVDGGKIAIIADTIVCKEGDVISENLAAMLTRLNIMPMEVGLDITAVWENGEVMQKKYLDIDEDAYIGMITQAARWAMNLSIEAAIPTDKNAELLVQKAFRDAKALALSQNIPADAIMAELIGKAERQMLNVKKTANIPDAPKSAEKQAVDNAQKIVKEAQNYEKAQDVKADDLLRSD